MTEAPDGSLWLASRGGLVGAGDPRTARFRTAARFQAGRRLTAVGSWDGRVLVGTTRGLALLDPPSGREVGLEGPLRAHGLAGRPIAAIRSDPDVAWIASGREVFRIARDGGRGPARVQRLEIPVAGSVSALSTVGAGRLWIGSDTGEIAGVDWSGPAAAVAVRVLDVVEPSGTDSLAAHGFVSALHEDRHGQLWVGTRRGLGRIVLASGRVSWLGQPDGLPSTSISGIEADGNGQLWIGHNRGLTRMQPAGGAAERLRAAVEGIGSELASEGGPACTLSIGFAAFPCLPHEPDALSWEQTLDLADHALRLTKRRRRNSYTGLRATRGLTGGAVLEFLDSNGGAAIPAAMAIVMPGEDADASRQPEQRQRALPEAGPGVPAGTPVG